MARAALAFCSSKPAALAYYTCYYNATTKAVILAGSNQPIVRLDGCSTDWAAPITSSSVTEAIRRGALDRMSRLATVWKYPSWWAMFVTLSALSWDPHDWNWKLNHDTGLVYEQLFAADLTKSKQYGGTHPFYADAWLPSDAIRGELAETWSFDPANPLRMIIKLRKGVMFPAKPGVMEAREFVADDVVFARSEEHTSELQSH